MFFLKITLAIYGSWWSHMRNRIFVYFCKKKCQWDFFIYSIESVDEFGWDEHFNNISSFNSSTCNLSVLVLSSIFANIYSFQCIYISLPQLNLSVMSFFNVSFVYFISICLILLYVKVLARNCECYEADRCMHTWINFMLQKS